MVLHEEAAYVDEILHSGGVFGIESAGIYPLVKRS